MKKALLLGGTGTISSAVAARLLDLSWEVTVCNRGTHPAPAGAEQIVCDVHDSGAMESVLSGRHFDAVADFLVYTPADAEARLALFDGKTDQYLFISTASAYQKPLNCFRITESTPLKNPYWQYSRDKIACEDLFLHAWRTQGFPVTIVRPSHTYGPGRPPLPLHGEKGPWQTLQRILDGKPVLVHGDGLSLWTVTWNEDFARGFADLCGNPLALGECVHITSDQSVTWNQILESIGRALGRTPQLVHIASETLAALRPSLLGTLLGDKAWSVSFDNSKIKRLSPHFGPCLSADEGITRAVQTLLETPALQVPDPEFDAWCDSTVARYFSVLRG